MLERRLLEESMPGQPDSSIDPTYPDQVWDALVARGLLRPLDRPDDDVEWFETTAKGKKAMELDALARSLTAWCSTCP